MNKSIFFAAGLCVLMSMSSCSTIFTGTKQSVTFTGEPGIGIYKNNNKITEIAEGGTSTVKIQKSLSSANLIAKKEGYLNTPLVLSTVFNPISAINLLNPIAWIVDLGTGAACKYDDSIVVVEMKKN